ncbi:putative thioredoxin, tetratricopeptide-like helical domain-containing protein [Medicago truncatula]|uniref:Putative thioredoxin, tetratricopeptide-like helical domain-containing protein n=1 Tax=Medicago truncatula TaxID=3880 RepID=A0A396GYM2_MEDTR|nr:putative thioredoxin, tetratricopeptide-like helical domain-containing protein [Medicago truncatula]
MDIGKVSELKEFIESCKSNPSLLHTPSLQFFKSYLLSLGARIPPQPKTEPVVDDDDIIESDIEFDNTDDVVQPDNDPPHKMGDPSAQVTDDQRDAAQLSKSKAIDAISQASVFIKLKKPNAAIRDSDTALKINPDSAKGYKIRGLSRAMLGLWTEALTDLHVASKIDYDEEIAMALKKVEPNAHKIEEHRKKYERLRKQKEQKRAQPKKQPQNQAQDKDALSALKDGQVIGVHSVGELETKLSAASKTSRLLVLYFTATWCGPCRYISPLYTSLAEKYQRVVFLKVDIDEAVDVAARWNVSSVPTFFFVKNGKEVDSVVGADKNTLERKIAQHSGPL